MQLQVCVPNQGRVQTSGVQPTEDWAKASAEDAFLLSLPLLPLLQNALVQLEVGLDLRLNARGDLEPERNIRRESQAARKYRY